MDTALEHKFCRPDTALHLTQDATGLMIEGYASLFGIPDQGGMWSPPVPMLTASRR